MFTFVIWAVGLYFLAHIAFWNFALVIGAFTKHWLLGLLILGASVIGWITLLGMIL